MNFWICGIGRSGTKWLSTVLGQGDHTVRHEGADWWGNQMPWYYAPFPMARFERRNYGECHGLLIRHLSPLAVGAERRILRRAILLRNDQDVVRSWMDRRGHVDHDLSWVTRTVVSGQRQLIEYAKSDPGCRVLHLERLADVSVLQELVDWIGIELRITSQHLRPINATRDRRFEWTRERYETFKHVAAKFSLRD